MEENSKNKKIFEIYLWVKSQTMYSKLLSKIILIFIYLEFILLNLMIYDLNKNVKKNENNMVKISIEIYSLKYFLNSYNFLYYILSYCIKIFIITNLLSCFILLSDNLKFLHFKKIKKLFSFSNFSLGTLFVLFFVNILLEEIFQKKYFFVNQEFSLVINLIILIIFLCLGIFHNLFKRMEYFNKEDFLNTKNKFFYLKIFIFKIIMIFGMKIVEFNFSKLYIILLNIFYGIIYFYIYFSNFKEIKFQNEDIDVFHIILISIVCGSWFSNFFIQIIQDLNFWEIFILFSLCLVLLSLTSKKNIKKFLIKSNKKKINLHEYILLLTNLLSDLDKKKIMFLKGIIINHKIFCKKIDCFCLKKKLYNSNENKYSNIEENDNSSLILFGNYILKELLIEKIEKKENKKYLFILIEFFIKKMNNYYLALFYWKKLNLMNLNFLEKFDLLKLKKDLEEIIKTTGLEKFDDRNVEEIIFYDKTFNYLKKEILDLVSEIILFWKNFENQTTKIINNQNITQMFEIIKRKKKCQKIWEVLKTYFRHNPALELSYKIFQKEILNKKINLNIQDLYMRKKFNNNNMTISEKSKNIFGQNFYKHFFDKNSCVISLSLSNQDSGIITQTNKNIKNLFNFEKEELIGKSINILIPKTLKKFHSKILKQIKKKGKILFKSQNFLTTAINSKNEPISLKLYYKSLLSKNFKISLIAYMHVLKKEEDYPFLITDKYGFIITFSGDLSDILNLKASDCVRKNIHVGFFNLRFLKFFEIFDLGDGNKRNFKNKDIILENFQMDFFEEEEYTEFYDFFKGFEDKEVAELDNKSFLSLKNKINTFKTFLKSKKIVKEKTGRKISIELDHKREKLKQDNKKELNFFFIKKVYEIKRNSENKEEKKLISYKYNRKNSFSQIKQYDLTIDNTESKLNKTRIQEINYLKRSTNNFYKNKKNFPKKQLRIIQTICIIFFLILLLMIILDLIFLNIFQLKKIDSLNIIFKSLFGYFTLIKKTSITHNNFLSIFIPDYKFDFLKRIKENSILSKKFLEGDLLRENLIEFSKGRKLKVNLVNDRIFETNYFYLFNSYLSSMLNLDFKSEIGIFENKYWIFLNTYKKHLFEIINPLKIYYNQEIEENFKSFRVVKSLNFIIMAFFIFLSIIFFVIFLIQTYKNIFIFIEAFKFIEQSMITDIVNYYERLKNFLIDKYNMKIKEEKKDMEIKIHISKEKFEGNKILDKNKRKKSYKKEKIDEEENKIISIKKEKKTMCVKLFFLFIIFLIMFFAKIFIKDILINNIKNLQNIGIYIFEDYWKIPNIIMNSKDFYINSTSFNIFDENFKNNFNEENEIEIGNFYSKKFKIGKIINNLYKVPICKNQFTEKLLLDNQIYDCEKFFSGIFNSNLITLKKLLRSRLGFFITNSNPKNFNYTISDIPNYDKIQNIIAKFLGNIVDQWWLEYFEITNSYKSYFKFINIFWIFFMCLSFFLIYSFTLKKLDNTYKIFKKIYLHFIPLKTLDKNKLIGVKLKKANII